MGKQNVLLMQLRPTENRSTVPEPSSRGSCVELVLLLVADPRLCRGGRGGIACVHRHSTRRIGGAMQRVLWGVMSVRGRSEEDLVCDLEMEMEPRDATAGGEDLDDVRQM